jgi:V/A-type H+-transporting ATPase subunit K
MNAEIQSQMAMSMGKLAGALVLCLSAVGSAMGTGTAAMAAAGAWKKCYVLNRLAPFMLVAFVGLPLTQTIYGMIVMNAVLTATAAGPMNPFVHLVGLAGGAAIGLTSWLKGRAGAAASDAMAETGKGFINYLIALGVIETVSLFVMVFVTRTLA